MIQKLGYTVRVAESCTKALELYLKHKDRIQLVILDMIMPEMSGDKTFDRLRSINTDVKVLLSNGYSINGDAMDLSKNRST